MSGGGEIHRPNFIFRRITSKLKVDKITLICYNVGTINERK